MHLGEDLFGEDLWDPDGAYSQLLYTLEKKERSDALEDGGTATRCLYTRLDGLGH